MNPNTRSAYKTIHAAIIHKYSLLSVIELLQQVDLTKIFRLCYGHNNLNWMYQLLNIFPEISDNDNIKDLFCDVTKINDILYQASNMAICL